MSVPMTEQESVFSGEVVDRIASLLDAAKGPYRMQDGSGCGMTCDGQAAETLLREGFETLDGRTIKCSSRGTWLSEKGDLWYDLGYPIAIMQAWQSKQAPF